MWLTTRKVLPSFFHLISGLGFPCPKQSSVTFVVLAAKTRVCGGGTDTMNSSSVTSTTEVCTACVSAWNPSKKATQLIRASHSTLSGEELLWQDSNLKIWVSKSTCSVERLTPSTEPSGRDALIDSAVMSVPPFHHCITVSGWDVTLQVKLPFVEIKNWLSNWTLGRKTVEKIQNDILAVETLMCESRMDRERDEVWLRLRGDPLFIGKEQIGDSIDVRAKATLAYDRPSLAAAKDWESFVPGRVPSTKESLSTRTG